MSEQKLVETIQARLTDYRPDDEALAVLKRAKILLLVGITGAGKNRLIEELLKTGKFYNVISHTTRSPRENNGVKEQDGVEYHFIDNAQLLKMLDNGEFIECKFIHQQQFSGTSIAEIKKAVELDKIALTEIEVQGVDEYAKLKPDTVAVFVLPPSYAQWLERLKKRGVTNPAELRRRFKSARMEIQTALDRDYYQFVVNNDLPTAISDIMSIIDDPRATRREAQATAKMLLAEIEKSLA